MRKITQEATNAFLNGQTFNKQNMSVSVDSNITTLRLHGNMIARIQNNKLYISNAGWSSNTTKERLNALPNVRINQKNFDWFLNGREWNGNWTNPEEWDEQTRLIAESKENFLV